MQPTLKRNSTHYISLEINIEWQGNVVLQHSLVEKVNLPQKYILLLIGNRHSFYEMTLTTYCMFLIF